MPAGRTVDWSVDGNERGGEIRSLGHTLSATALAFVLKASEVPSNSSLEFFGIEFDLGFDTIPKKI